MVVDSHRAQLVQFFHKVRVLGILFGCCPNAKLLQDSERRKCCSPSFLFSKANGLSGRRRAGSGVAAAGEPAGQDGFSLGSLRAALEGALPMTRMSEMYLKF